MDMEADGANTRIVMLSGTLSGHYPDFKALRIHSRVLQIISTFLAILLLPNDWDGIDGFDGGSDDD